MGCGASSKGGGGKYVADSPIGNAQQSWAAPVEPRSPASSQGVTSPAHGSGKARPVSSSSRAGADGRTGSYRKNKAAASEPPAGASQAATSPTGGARPQGPRAEQVPAAHSSPSWEVQEFDKDEAAALAAGAVVQEAHQELTWDSCTWWGECAEWIYRRSAEILAAYNFFFEHITLRKGWRVAPFKREDVQAPFRAAAEVVVVVRAKLDTERGEGVLVLRQVEGSSMDFLWGWSPSCSPASSCQATNDFLRGLVFATLSDGKGLVEGLDSETVEGYVCSHPLLVAANAPGAAAIGEAAVTPSS